MISSQIAITNNVEIKYQKIKCIDSKAVGWFIIVREAIFARKVILIMFNIKKEMKEIISIFILFRGFMFGVENSNINKR